MVGTSPTQGQGHPGKTGATGSLSSLCGTPRGAKPEAERKLENFPDIPPIPLLQSQEGFSIRRARNGLKGKQVSISKRLILNQQENCFLIMYLTPHLPDLSFTKAAFSVCALQCHSTSPGESHSRSRSIYRPEVEIYVRIVCEFLCDSCNTSLPVEIPEISG